MSRDDATHTSRRWRFGRVPRWAWLAALCVALGLVTSVGVAWGIAWNDDTLRAAPQRWCVLKIEASPLHEESPIMWGITERVGRGRSVTLVEVLYTGLFNRVTAARLQDSAGLPREVRRGLERHAPLLNTPEASLVCFSVRRWGWPLCCVAAEDACTSQSANAFPQTEFADISMDVGWFETPQWPVTNPAFNLRPHYHAIEFRGRLLPTFPLWPGLLANTAFYGGAWAVLIFTPLVIRRWLRGRRGGCAARGYSREGLKDGVPCPECGRAA
jgi:hypothetical protein